MVLALIPLLGLLGLALSLYNLRPAWGWRVSLIRGASLTGGYGILITELLSLVEGVRQIPLSTLWLAPSVGSIILLWRIQGERGIQWPKIALPSGWLNRLLLAGIVLALLMTGVVAVAAPPHTPDSLNYHMSRVAHWAQQGSLDHFATGIEVQNSRTPGAEILVLHLYQLDGGDRFANMVQWMAMALSLVAVSLVAGQLGAGRTGQILAAAFLVTLPMGIAQASSTMTDYVATFWVLVLVVEALSMARGRWILEGPFFIGLALSLALITKPTAVPYILPFGLLALWVLIRNRDWGFGARAAAVVVALVLLLNLGHSLRNLQTYGSIFNPEQTAIHQNELRTWRGVTSNLLRHLGLHATTPWEGVNRFVYLGIAGVHFKVGVELNDPRTTAHGEFGIGPPSRYEDLVTNPAHAALLIIAAGITLLRWKHFGKGPAIYLVGLGFSLILMSYLFKWQIFASRYHMPFFALAAPLAGLALSRGIPKGAGQGVGLLLFVASWPWLTRLESRPLIPQPERARVENLFTTPREELLFANVKGAYGTFSTLTSAIQEANCGQVGIMISGAGLEYPFWALLGSPREDLNMQWIVAGTPSAKYEQQGFQPCAVLCQRCPEEWVDVRGVPLEMEVDDYRLFLEKSQ